MKNVVVITGPAGCGLSSAEFVFEELGYYLVKNAPSGATEAILDAVFKSGLENVAFVAHARNVKRVVNALKNRKDVNFRLIILNCNEDELFKRFTLTRHTHPRSVIESISPSEAIKRDIADTLVVVPDSDLYIDTTALTVKQLRGRLYKFLNNVEDDKHVSITFISFGLKNGIPQGIDCFFDVREIPNPYWVEELKTLTGEDQPVIDYMNQFPVTQKLISDIETYIEGRMKGLQETGRGSYVVGIACSGGQHRSTYVANMLCEHFSKDYRSSVIHRDTPTLNKDE